MIWSLLTPNPENNKGIKLNERVDSIRNEVGDDQTIALINFSIEKQKLLCDKTARDPSMNLIKEIVR